ncbi:glycyl-radical enzyme activating protein [Lachnotalea glycerini]|uniref:Glycyl-radical enzyme activating protein n=1 Tax=Lachnotalea glycerini TaxID=1763509 RepID=A0A371JED3_9FIRM|nr:glycyl-radical enzyme activating protein [Lachnotalea glycerini]RDY31121.1 glycyl-radical enzyme activating protein [Lachnotalea glycerini]
MNNDYLKVKGRIFDIQRYSIHDGPGIRTIIFLKGCALRCKWCCNPESQSFDIEKMKVKGKDKLIGRDVTVEEVMKEVMKDIHYYNRSQGGITLSGGECLLQPDFAVALLRAAKANGINTAIESTAFTKFEIIEKFLPFLDLFLLDIKHLDTIKHKQFTSQPNERILENAMRLAMSGQHLIIRVPVIPTFNDTIIEIRSIAEYAKVLPGVEELHLLPYHRLGSDKYEGLNREYELKDLEPPTNEQMQLLMEEAKKSGLKVQIGG